MKNSLPLNYHGRAYEAASKILDAFHSGQLPKALAPIFIRRNDDVPCRLWSWSNQLLVALFGHDDARGLRQWNSVGRSVKSGEQGFPILVPLVRKRVTTDDQTGEEQEVSYAFGFKHTIVFGYEQTDGDPLPEDHETRHFLDALPMVDVARSWGLHVNAIGGSDARSLGSYSPTCGTIALGVENLSTWAHELVHAADHRCQGSLKTGQHPDQEIVAELGGAVLLEVLGYEREADLGGCWEYVCRYAEQAEVSAIVS